MYNIHNTHIFIILYYIILYYIVLYYIILYYTHIMIRPRLYWYIVHMNPNGYPFERIGNCWFAGSEPLLLLPWQSSPNQHNNSSSI